MLLFVVANGSMTLHPRQLTPLLLVTALACGGPQPASEPSSPVAESGQVLAMFASERIMVLPLQGLRRDDDLGWIRSLGNTLGFLDQVDSTLEASLRTRFGATNWIFPAELARAARRNPMHATDPASIRAGDAIRAIRRRSSSSVREPVASQLRTLAGLVDVRYVLIPVELRFAPGRSDSGRGGLGILDVTVLDVRTGRLHWSGRVLSDLATAPDSTLLASLGGRFADLVVAR